MIGGRDIILASASPRRSELLKLCGVSFKVIVADIDESILPAETPEQAIRRLSLSKAERIAVQYPKAYVIGADTDVVLDGEVFGKPSSMLHAKEMLSRLQGRTHHVIGAFSIICIETDIRITRFYSTEVTFVPMSPVEIEAYVATKEPLDKAGAYAIQGHGMQYIENIRGSYSNVVGLNVTALMHELKLLYQL
jgi:septum formation protein